MGEKKDGFNAIKRYINKFAANLQNGDRKLLEARLESLTSAFPFNEYEYMLMFLRDKGIIDFEEYEKLRANYVSTNKYLKLYGLAPRIFGQVWGEEHIRDLDGRFQRMFHCVDKALCGRNPYLLQLFVSRWCLFLVGTFIRALLANTSNKVAFVA